MPINTGDTELDARLNNLLTQVVMASNPPQLLSNTPRIREAAFHNFSTYQYLLPPTTLGAIHLEPIDDEANKGERPTPPEVPTDTWLDLQRFTERFYTAIARQVNRYFAHIHFDGVLGSRPRQIPPGHSDRIAEVTTKARNGFRIGMAYSLHREYKQTVESDAFILAAVTKVEAWFDSKLQELLSNIAIPKLVGDISDIPQGTTIYVPWLVFSAFPNASMWEKGIETVKDALPYFPPLDSPEVDDIDAEESLHNDLPAKYPFDVFNFLPDNHRVNFGLQVVYRQGWTPLGTQPGEIVRTLPLGPKQSEKVTVKAVRRTKATRQTEISTSVETSTESSAATKDSSEVIQEATESFNWHVEAEASASVGFASASVTAGAGGDSSSASKNTKSGLNETMEKTASKIRKDTKIIVSTEVEETSEFTQVSEISNPNDEIAVTYIYSRLQRQYEIQTYLSEVNTVVFVAQEMPSPKDIDGSWIRRHDWIIARELLDESFRADLETIRNFEPDKLKVEEIDSNIQRLMESISGQIGGNAPGIPDYAGLPGQVPNLFQNQQQAYEREVERRRAREANIEQYKRSVRRLRRHIYDNILHYCRVIWSSEDPDSRLMRYSRIVVPRNWAVSSTGKATGIEIAPSGPDKVPLSEMINPAGPIGFAGNYAVFYLKESVRWESLLRAIRLFQLPYLKVVVEILRGTLAETVRVRATISDTLTSTRRHTLQYFAATNEIRVTNDNFGVYPPRLIASFPAVDGAPMVFSDVKVWIDGVSDLADGDQFHIEVHPLPILEDPELKTIRWIDGPLPPDLEPQFYTAETILEMRSFFADINSAFQNLGNPSWDDLEDEQKNLLRNKYYDYILRKSHTRRILLDTNNVLLTREIDDATTLEPFKGVHRVLDVLSVIEDLMRKMIENSRRQKRVDADLLGDPDVEKLTVVAAAENLTDLASLDGLSPDGENETTEELQG